MNNNVSNDYAIKYKVVNVGPNEFLLFPLSVVEGVLIGDVFNSSMKIKMLTPDNIKDVKYVVDNVLTLDDLVLLYDYDEDSNLLRDYYFEDQKNVILYVCFDGLKLIKKEIDLDLLRKMEYVDTYMMTDDIPSITLNDNSLNKLLECDDLELLKIYLKKYKNDLKKFEYETEKNGVTRLEITNGKITSMDNKKIIKNSDDDNTEYRDYSSKNDISYDGLRNYIKERVFGHDSEIDIISKILYMNYTAIKGEKTDSILLIGSTGTGKTETFNAAMDYLNLPLISVNASNLVPQGIKGCSLEDCLYTLYLRAGKNLPLAEKGIVFLDEYDKLSFLETEFKKDLKNILLTFNAGGDFNIENNSSTFVFNSSLISKVYAGVFSDIYTNKSVMGFSNNKKDGQNCNLSNIRKSLLDKAYFTEEELSRIKYILNYSDLTKEVKKKILLESKLSEFFIKKKRYERQFGVSLEMDDSYIDAVLDKISSSSMREINNIVSSTLDMAEIEMIQSSDIKGKRLVLTKDTVLNPKNYNLIK